MTGAASLVRLVVSFAASLLPTFGWFSLALFFYTMGHTEFTFKQ